MATTNLEFVDNYKDRYVAFIDLLGFKNLIIQSEKSPDHRKFLHQILDIVRDTLCRNDSPKLGSNFTYFSDCIVVTTERTFEGLLDIFQSISILSFNLLQYDILIRGGLTCGGTHHGQDFVYGTAVNRAHEIESALAKNPMTMLSEEVIQDAMSYDPMIKRYLVTDPSNKYFVHYLLQFAEYRPTPIYPGLVLLEDPAQRVIDYICQRLNTATDSPLDKAKWVQEYWNSTVAIQGIFGRIESGATPTFTSRGPTTMMRRVVAS
jgi:hypothetical protein